MSQCIQIHTDDKCEITDGQEVRLNKEIIVTIKHEQEGYVIDIKKYKENPDDFTDSDIIESVTVYNCDLNPESIIVDINDIEWDTDGEDVKDLPTCIAAVKFEVDDPEDEDEIEELISDWLSDRFGFCHNGFNWTFHK